MRTASGLLLSTLLIAACSDDGGFTGATSDGAGAAGGNGGQGGLVLAGGGGDGGSGLPGGCSEAATFVYVLSDTNELYSFQPAEKVFTKIGELGCPTVMQPNSMAIDRDAIAWVNYVQPDDSAGALFRVDTADASCDPSPALALPQGWARVGMGFSSDTDGSENETLFVTGVNQGGRLGRVDFGTQTVVPVGAFTGAAAGQNAELTGTGDARLYAFFTSTPVYVDELDKTSAALVTQTPLPTVEVPNAWAFSFWGGDFYLYTSTGGNSRVNRYRPSDGSVDTNYVADVGFRILGAGVSTCAPVEPPK